MFSKFLTISLVCLSVLFNIQVGFTHSIEHHYHDHDHDSHNGVQIDCEDCDLKHNLAKSVSFDRPFDFQFSNFLDLDDNYHLSNNILYSFIAYQSQAP